jgi:hypothetical protein
LRYPVTRLGHPICVEIDGIDRLFSRKLKHGRPTITRMWSLAIGSRKQPLGIRELDQRGNTIHVLAGNLDSDQDRSFILEAHPEGAAAKSAHYTFELPVEPRPRPVKCRLARRFKDAAAVEGITVNDDGTTWYVHDDEKILLNRAKA